MNDEDNEGWWSEEYWKTSRFEDERNFLLWFGNWFVEFIVIIALLLEAIFYTFNFLNKHL